jgi:phospholipid-binding lipoprotein MlaA
MRQTETAAPSSIPGPAPDTGLRLDDNTDSGTDSGEISDPWEPMNRIFFSFNETIDLVLLRPIAIGYDFIMPGPVKTSVRRFFLNLDAPVILANDLLQGDLRDAGVTVSRFGINSTIGVLGLFDPAASFGLDRHHADFGQTLHSYNVGAGPYLVLPLLGPASTRGGVGKVVDIFFQPLTYILTTGQNLALTATRAVVKREELLEPLDELRENSIDYYTGLKAAYWQTRQVELNKGTLPGHAGDGTDQLFDAAN